MCIHGMMERMTLENERVLLTRLSPSLARRIIDGREEPGDAWHRDYPFADELAPLSALAATTETGSPFTMYAIREARTGLAVGGFGFFGPPDSSGTVEFGYGLIPAARGRGLATARLASLLTTLGRGERVGQSPTPIRAMPPRSACWKKRGLWRSGAEALLCSSSANLPSREMAATPNSRHDGEIEDHVYPSTSIISVTRAKSTISSEVPEVLLETRARA